MRQSQSLDSLVKRRLKQWPQRPPGVKPAQAGTDAWLRGRPSEDLGTCHPFLKLPGSTRWRTLPDGLWLNFSGTPVEPYVDILAIEACGSLQNLLDKRSRFAPSTQSLLAVCPVPGLRIRKAEGIGQRRRTIRGAQFVQPPFRQHKRPRPRSGRRLGED